MFEAKLLFYWAVLFTVEDMEPIYIHSHKHFFSLKNRTVKLYSPILWPITLYSRGSESSNPGQPSQTSAACSLNEYFP